MTQVFQPMLTAEFSLAAALGLVPRYSTVNRFGAASDCDQDVPTDVWDGADGTTSTDIWVAPTQARIHDIVSSDAADTADGTGMRHVEIHGLCDWDDDEDVHEDIILDGTTPVQTTLAYVVIYRMVSRTYGSGGTNAGFVKATAVTDNTITAVIRPGNGQTMMCVASVPRGYLFAITALHCNMTGNSTAIATGSLLCKEEADQATAGWVVWRTWEFGRSTHYDEDLDPPIVFTGPCIVKMQVVSNAANVACAATFEGYKVNERDRLITHN